MADRTGFDEFMVDRSRSLLRTAYMLTHDWAAAEDLLQEALTKAWFAWKRILGNPEPYVRRILVTEYISQQRRRWRRELPTDDVHDRTAGWAAGRAAPGDHEQSDERDALWRALGRLPARQRAVVVLRYYEDLSENDVAVIMSCSVGTVKSQAAKALIKLRVDATLAAEPVSEEG